MKTQDSNTESVQTPPTRTSRPRDNRRWPTSIAALMVVGLVVGLSMVVFARLGQHRSSQGIANVPPGKWMQVLQGYTLTSVAAAPGNSAVIYACAILPQQSRQVPPGSGPGKYTLLRSTDSGARWQDIGGKIVLDGSCVFAINPTDNNDIYAVSPSRVPQGPNVLQHSTDGGQTWHSFIPTLQVPGLPYIFAWHVLQLSMEGNRLFGVQYVAQSTVSTPGQAILPGQNFPLRRLMTSVDGGHNWTVLDSHINATAQGMSSYAVDPTNHDTIYEVVGVPLLPAQRPLRLQGSDAAVTLYAGPGGELYKTMNGGATWQLLLQGLPFGVQVSLASNKPNLVYLGGLIGPRPYAPQSQEATSTVGTFYLSVSNDEGANWRQVGLPPQASKLQNWSVGPSGEVYAAMYLIPATTTAFTPTAIATPAPSIYRYDPAINIWSEVTKAPSPGSLLAATATNMNGRTALWFMGTSNGSETLYRNVV